MKQSITFVTKPVAIAVAGALSLYGCLGGDGGVAGGSAAIVAGAAANTPLDGAPLKVTCADGTAGGSGTTTKGSYTVAVSCASTNYPIVIEIDETALSKLTTKPTMAGPDMQFGTSDDETYDTASRAALRVAVQDSTVTSANMNAVTTLAAQPIKDKIDAVVAKTAGATKPTAADVQTAESNTQTALGISTAIKSSDPVKDSAVARVNAQVLEAVAVTTALAGSAVKPGDVMKEVANAAATGKAVTKTESDGGKSFDITTATGNLAAGAVKTAMTSAAGVESAIKAKGTAMEQVAKVVAAIPAAQTFDPAKANLSSLAADIKTELAKTGNAAANTATVNAKVASEALKQAVAKVKEIDASTTIASGEKDNRKKAALEAAEAVRMGVEKEVTSSATALTADQRARAIASVATAVQVAGDMIKTATIGDIVDTATNKPKASVAGLAEKVRTDVSSQISSKTETQLGDLKSITPTAALGASAVTTIQTAATNVVSALKDYVPPAGASDAAVRVAVDQVVAKLDPAVTDPTAVKANLQGAITGVVNNLTTALTQSVTVGGVTQTMNQLPPEQQAQLLAQTAANMIGTSTLNFTAPPTIGSVTTAVTSATTTVSNTVVAPLDTPTFDKTTLTDGTGTINTASCSADVTVSGINVGVPIKVTATANGVAATISAGDAFGTPPTVGGTTQPAGLKVFVKMNGGALPPVYPNPNGVLVGGLMTGQKFALCVVPTAADTNYTLKAEVGSMYDFATNQFKDSTKVKSITYSAKTSATTTTTTTTTTKAATTTTAAAATTTTTAAATTTTAAATTTTASTTTTTAGASFAGVCQVKAGNVLAFVTGVPAASNCTGSGTGSLGFDAMSATVTSVAAAGTGTSVAWTALKTCDPFGAPPAAGATTGTPCKN